MAHFLKKKLLNPNMKTLAYYSFLWPTIGSIYLFFRKHSKRKSYKMTSRGFACDCSVTRFG